jgi:deoxycytidylate deaminase
VRAEKLLANAVAKLRAEYDELMKTELTAFHCAILVSGSAVLSTGMNKHKLNSFVSVYAHHPDVQTIHAELDAILQVRRKTDLTGCKIYVAKLGRNGEVGNSCPCAMCHEALRNYGIKRAYYTVNETTYAVERLNGEKWSK